MNIETKQERTLTILVLSGRLDATWAEGFLGTAQDQLRMGRHHLRADCADLSYLSSAGIRSLIRIRRDVMAIDGTFLIRNPSEFVEKTLRLSGLDGLLEPTGEADRTGLEEYPTDSAPPVRVHEVNGTRMEMHVLDDKAGMLFRRLACWVPWQPIRDDGLVTIRGSESLVSLGIGAPGGGGDDPLSRLGEYIALSGCVGWNPCGVFDKPDYQVQQERFIPEILAIQALTAQGEFSHLLRFTPQEEHQGLPLSDLVERAFDVTGSAAVVLVLVAEIEGLVGTALNRSPGLMKDGEDPRRYPDVLDWLSFCGERLHGERTGITVMFAWKKTDGLIMPDLTPLPSRPDILGHAHTLVFPYRPIPEGQIDLKKTVRGLFDGPEPIDMLHLIEDNRPLVGIGQSAFLRGACWCAALSSGQGEDR
jgi:anti-anti-sigma factor